MICVSIVFVVFLRFTTIPHSPIRIHKQTHIHIQRAVMQLTQRRLGVQCLALDTLTVDGRSQELNQ